jgi:hypothetical protein
MSRNTWIIVILIAIIVIIVAVNYIRRKTVQQSQGGDNSNIATGNVFNPLGNTTPGTVVVPPPTVVIPPASAQTFVLRDKIFAGEYLIAYKTPAAGASNIYKSFDKGNFIGSYISTEGSYIKLARDNYGYTWYGVFGIISTDVIYVLKTAKVYKK